MTLSWWAGLMLEVIDEPRYSVQWHWSSTTKVEEGVEEEVRFRRDCNYAVNRRIVDDE